METTIDIKATDMDDEDVKKVQEISIKAISSYRQEKQIAHSIKYELDKLHGFGWNCIVGRNFGSHVIHQTKRYIFFSYRELFILLWKA